MSFSASLIFRGVVIATVVAMCVGLTVAVGSVVVTVFSYIDVALDGFVSEALLTGRQLANNFINPYVLNGCITAWFTAYPLCGGIYLALQIQKWLDI